jgi:hypothetical protein
MVQQYLHENKGGTHCPAVQANCYNWRSTNEETVLKKGEIPVTELVCMVFCSVLEITGKCVLAEWALIYKY